MHSPISRGQEEMIFYDFVNTEVPAASGNGQKPHADQCFGCKCASISCCEMLLLASHPVLA